MATHISILPRKTPWTEEPDGLQSRCHKESDMTERAHTHTHLHAFVKGVVRNIISYIKTNLEASCFLSYFFFLNFLPLSMFFQIIPRPPLPILPFFQSHSLLDFISLKKHIYLFVSMCTRQVWINNHNEAQNYTSVFFLPWTSAGQQKISRTEGAAGREKATPVPFSPHTVNPRLSWLQTLCITLFRQGSLDPLQTSCQLMFCSLMQMMLELLKCSSVSGQNINKLTVSSHPTSIIVPGGCITLYEPARLLWQMNITLTSINLSSLLIGVL